MAVMDVMAVCFWAKRNKNWNGSSYNIANPIFDYGHHLPPSLTLTHAQRDSSSPWQVVVAAFHRCQARRKGEGAARTKRASDSVMDPVPSPERLREPLRYRDKKGEEKGPFRSPLGTIHRGRHQNPRIFGPPPPCRCYTHGTC